MPALNGLDFLLKAKQKRAYNYGILLTAYADKDMLENFIAKDLIRMVIEKPLDLEKLDHVLKNACEICIREKRECEKKEQIKQLCLDYLSGKHEPEMSIIGKQSGLKETLEKVFSVAALDENVLITGETGTGKELIAREIHNYSQRRNEVFVKINCGALPENLIESELFGHVKGAFSGAHRSRRGKIELSNGGTLFLDEVGELSEYMQTRLLHVVQDRYIEMIGESSQIPVDFRLICATNRDLQKSSGRNIFREDLYYRISTYPIHVPPLRERTQDIEKFVYEFVTIFSRQLCISNVRINNEAVALLQQYSWPGNVRELENVIKRALITIHPGTETIGPDSFRYLFSDLRPIAQSETALDRLSEDILSGRESLKSIEQKILGTILEKCNNSISAAVKNTGIPKDRFYRNRKG